MLKEWISENFYPLQIAIGTALVFLLWKWSVASRSESQFKVREADRLKGKAGNQDPDLLANARMQRNSRPLLGGIRLDQPDHLILGVKETATLQEIEDAYKKLMKQYHPDKVAPVGTDQWKEAQKIASALNKAREHMLKKIKKHA